MQADAYNARQLLRKAVSGRHLTQLTAVFQSTTKLLCDGRFGPKTAAAVETVLSEPTPVVVHEALTEPQEAPAIVRRDWSPWIGPLDAIPKNRREVYRVFGNPGTVKVDNAWKRAGIVTVRDLPGVPHKWHVSLHKLAEPYFREGLRRAELAAPGYTIRRFGGFVFRHIRHKSNRPLSMHSWGIAADQNAEDNRGIRFGVRSNKGKPPKAWTTAWLRLWPGGVPESFVQAMTSVGLTWGSDWDRDHDNQDHSYQDPMHFELVDRS